VKTCIIYTLGLYEVEKGGALFLIFYKDLSFCMELISQT
jgi:hypothetical protein